MPYIVIIIESHHNTVSVILSGLGRRTLDTRKGKKKKKNKWRDKCIKNIII